MGQDIGKRYISVLWVIIDLSVKHLYESYVPQRKGDSFTKDGDHKMAVAWSSNKHFTESPTHILQELCEEHIRRLRIEKERLSPATDEDSNERPRCVVPVGL